MKQKPWIWWHLRLTFETEQSLTEYAVKLEQLLIAMTSQYIVVKEISQKEKPHIHMNFLSNLSESKLRDFLIPKGLGRMDKYLKEIEKENEMDCYVCKGELEGSPEILLKSNIKYTTEYIDECHKKYWEVYNKIDSKKKSKNCTFIDLVVNDLKTDFPEKVWESRELSHRRLVLSYILESLGKKGKGFDAIILKRLMNGCLNILDKRGMKAYMESLIFDIQEREFLGVDV